MSASDFIYHLLIFIGIIQSFVAVKAGHKRFIYIFWLLILTEVIELFALFMMLYQLRFAYIYHVFTVAEFALIALYFRSLHKAPFFKTALLFCIAAYGVLSLFLSAYYYQFKSFPGLNLSAEGLLLFLICVYTLFIHDPGPDGKYFRDPDIIITCGILIFFGATFVYNGVYSTLFLFNKSRALELFQLINKSLNLALYALINIGFLCLKMKKNYTTR